MKLRNLRGAIRKQTGGVSTMLPTPFGQIKVGLLKNELLTALSERFDGDDTAETGITLEDGTLKIDQKHLDVWKGVSKPADWAAPAAASTEAAPTAEDDDVEDFLSDAAPSPAQPRPEVEDFL